MWRDQQTPLRRAAQNRMACRTWQQELLSLGPGPWSVPLGLTLIEAQKVARRAEQLAVLKTVAEEQLLRLPGRYV